MKFLKLLGAVAALLLEATLASPINFADPLFNSTEPVPMLAERGTNLTERAEIWLNPNTVCQRYDPHNSNYSDKAMDKLLELWYKNWGHKGGTLRHGYQGRETYQGVCCRKYGLCLYIKHDFDGKDYHWDKNGFDYAVEEIRHNGKGMGPCATVLFTKKAARPEALTLKMTRADHKIAWQSRHFHGEIDKAIDLFGDTCSGRDGWIGPQYQGRFDQ